MKTDAVEAEFPTGQKDMRVAARRIADLGPKEVVLTHRDGVLVYDGNHFHEARFHPETLMGRSGRGDKCIASYMARRLSAPPHEAVIWAAALTSREIRGAEVRVEGICGTCLKKVRGFRSKIPEKIRRNV